MNFIESFEKELYDSGAMDVYKIIRQKIIELKKDSGFECKRCGLCCTTFIGLSEEDFFYMKEKGINLEGIKMMEFSDGSLIPVGLKNKLDDRGRKTVNCFYKEDKLCKIHPNNPLTCHTFPFVVNISSKLFFVHASCSFIQENPQGFAVRVKLVDEINDLIKYYHDALANFIG